MTKPINSFCFPVAGVLHQQHLGIFGNGISTNYPLFFTETILEWKTLLKPNKLRDIITNSLAFWVNDKRVLICTVLPLFGMAEFVVGGEHQQRRK